MSNVTRSGAKKIRCVEKGRLPLGSRERRGTPVNKEPKELSQKETQKRAITDSHQQEPRMALLQENVTETNICYILTTAADGEQKKALRLRSADE
jgi:hypothetical protein